MLQSNVCHLCCHFFIQTCTVHVKKNKKPNSLPSSNQKQISHLSDPPTPPLQNLLRNEHNFQVTYLTSEQFSDRTSEVSQVSVVLWQLLPRFMHSCIFLSFMFLSFFSCPTFATSQTHTKRIFWKL